MEGSLGFPTVVTTTCRKLFVLVPNASTLTFICLQRWWDIHCLHWSLESHMTTDNWSRSNYLRNMSRNSVILSLTPLGHQTCTIMTHKNTALFFLPSMAQLGWALLFLLGSWSSVEEGLPLPWAPPLLGAEVAELLQGSPPSVKDALHSGPPTKTGIRGHQGSQRSQEGQDSKRQKGDTHRSERKRSDKNQERVHSDQLAEGEESCILGDFQVGKGEGGKITQGLTNKSWDSLKKNCWRSERYRKEKQRGTVACNIAEGV